MKTDILDEHIRKKRLEAARQKEKTIKELKRAIRKLSAEIPFKRAFLFGSLLSTRFKEDSDIDIAFEGLNDKDFFRAMARLSDLLGRDVDIVSLEESRFREKILNSGLEIYKSQ